MSLTVCGDMGAGEEDRVRAEQPDQADPQEDGGNHDQGGVLMRPEGAGGQVHPRGYRCVLLNSCILMCYDTSWPE